MLKTKADTVHFTLPVVFVHSLIYTISNADVCFYRLPASIIK